MSNEYVCAPFGERRYENTLDLINLAPVNKSKPFDPQSLIATSVLNENPYENLHEEPQTVLFGIDQAQQFRESGTLWNAMEKALVKRILFVAGIVALSIAINLLIGVSLFAFKYQDTNSPSSSQAATRGKWLIDFNCIQKLKLFSFLLSSQRLTLWRFLV